MDIKDFYKKMIDDLRDDFESNYSSDVLFDWKNGFENRWYSEEGSRYTTELNKYLRENLYNYVENSTKDFTISQKQEMFEFLYLYGYKKCLVKDDKVLFIDILTSTNLVVILENRDYEFFTKILIDSNNTEELLDDLRNNFLYEMRCSDLSLYELKYLKAIGITKGHIKDLFFEDLCVHDSYGRNIYEYLSCYCTCLNNRNISSLLEHLYINDIYYKYMDIKVNKAKEFYMVIKDRIEEGVIKLEDESMDLSVLVLDSENKKDVLSSFYANLPKKKKELIKRYSKN